MGLLVAEGTEKRSLNSERNGEGSNAKTRGQNYRPRRLLWMSLNLIISILLITYLLRYVDLRSFVAITKRVPLWVLVAVFSLYLFLNWCRALRFRVLLDRNKPSMKTLF